MLNIVLNKTVSIKIYTSAKQQSVTVKKPDCALASPVLFLLFFCGLAVPVFIVIVSVASFLASLSVSLKSNCPISLSSPLLFVAYSENSVFIDGVHNIEVTKASKNSFCFVCA